MSKALLVISYGSSHAQTRKAAIEAIERDLRTAFPERRFYRAWTSAFLRKKLRESKGLSVDSPEEAVERMLGDGVTDVLAQPTHMMNGVDHSALRELLASRRERFSVLKLGAPLLADRADVRVLARVLEHVYAGVTKDELLALIGHGSAFAAPNPYNMLNTEFAADGFCHFRIGTISNAPGFVPVLSAARERKPARIILAPLMVAAGQHALCEITGTAEHSCQSILRQEGYETVSILKGLGEYAPVRELYVSHARRANETESR